MMVMCLAIPAKVVKVEGEKAVLDVFGETSGARVKTPRPKVGDYVLVQFGTVTDILDKKAAGESLKAWKEILR